MVFKEGQSIDPVPQKENRARQLLDRLLGSFRSRRNSEGDTVSDLESVKQPEADKKETIFQVLNKSELRLTDNNKRDALNDRFFSLYEFTKQGYQVPGEHSIDDLLEYRAKMGLKNQDVPYLAEQEIRVLINEIKKKRKEKSELELVIQNDEESKTTPELREKLIKIENELQADLQKILFPKQLDRLKELKRLEVTRLFAELHVFFDVLRNYDLINTEQIKKMSDDDRKYLYRTLGRFMNVLELFARESFSDDDQVMVIFEQIEDYLEPLIDLNKEDVGVWLEEIDRKAEGDPGHVHLAATVRGRDSSIGTKGNDFLTRRVEKFGVAADERRGILITDSGKFVLKKVIHEDDGSEVLALPYLDKDNFTDEQAHFSLYPQVKYMRQESHITLLKPGELDYDPEQDEYSWDQIEEKVMNGEITDTETIAALYVHHLESEGVEASIDNDPDDFAFGTVIDDRVKGDQWLGISEDGTYVTTPYDESLGVFYDPATNKFLLNYEFFPQKGNFAGMVLNGGAIGDHEVFSPKQTVADELAQEHGLKAKSSTELGRIKGASKYGGKGGASILHFVELSKERATAEEAEGGDERYEVGQKLLTLKQIQELIVARRIRCSRTIAAFMMAELHMKEPNLKE
ncbi:MAG: hypothetical protein OEX81_01365 [Candidatus Pacebacteria bacterium]|nr:hypothetical protein [Candidatus Paceibacterota bacterium]